MYDCVRRQAIVRVEMSDPNTSRVGALDGWRRARIVGKQGPIADTTMTSSSHPEVTVTVFCKPIEIIALRCHGVFRVQDRNVRREPVHLSAIFYSLLVIQQYRTSCVKHLLKNHVDIRTPEGCFVANRV